MLANTASVTISSVGDVKVKDGTGTTTTLPAGSWTIGPGLKLKLPGSDQAQALTGPLTFTATTSPLFFKRPYRGTFTLTSDGKKLTLVDTVGLEPYLYGVVPSEMPSTWLPEALGAQAVVARSYALAMRKTTGLFDVYGDTRSQVYGGVLAEKPTTTEAVDATAGEVLLYDGKVAVTYFYSSSGGKTASIADVWNAQPVPYLVSVPDPYDTISPYHDWGPLSFTAPQLGKALKVPGRLLDVQTTLNASGRVSEVDGVGDQGEVAVGAGVLRKALGLRSTWFTHRRARARSAPREAGAVRHGRDAVGPRPRADGSQPRAAGIRDVHLDSGRPRQDGTRTVRSRFRRRRSLPRRTG